MRFKSKISKLKLKNIIYTIIEDLLMIGIINIKTLYINIYIFIYMNELVICLHIKSVLKYRTVSNEI